VSSFFSGAVEIFFGQRYDMMAQAPPLPRNIGPYAYA